MIQLVEVVCRSAIVSAQIVSFSLDYSVGEDRVFWVQILTRTNVQCYYALVACLKSIVKGRF